MDGIGGSLNRLIRNLVMKRESVVSNVSEFRLVTEKYSKIKIIEMTQNDIFEAFSEMNLSNTFQHAPAISIIRKMHKIYVIKNTEIVKAVFLSSQ